MELHGIEKLKGAENWGSWKFTVRNLLRGTENAYEICIGKIPKPEPLTSRANNEESSMYQAEFKIWDKADRAASQIIVRTLEAKVIALLVKCETAREMWLKLHAVFEQQTKQAAHIVQTEFFNFRIDSTQDMITNIANFEGLTLRMQQLNVMPDESSLVVKLLDILPDEYDSLRQAWWARSAEQQTFQNLVEVLTSEELHRTQRIKKQEESTALLANKAKNQGKKEYSSKYQHTKKFNEPGTSKSKDKSFKCYNCGGKGHIRRYCPTDKQRRSDGTNVTTNNRNEEAFNCEVVNIELNNDAWIIDTGATDHVTCHREWFLSFKPFETPIELQVGNKSTMNALGRGTIKFEALVDKQWLPCRMENVLYVPHARRNLFSVSCALEKGMVFKAVENKCEFTKDSVVKACGIKVGKLFTLVIRIKQPVRETNLSSKDTVHIWHERLGHQNIRQVKKILKKHEIDCIDDNSFCSACIEGKQHRNSFQSRLQRANMPGEIIHADLCGPMECTSLGGSRYFLCFTCDYSKLRMVYFLKEKSETVEKIEEMLQVIKAQCGQPMKMFQCDGGLEFNNSKVKKLLASNGVLFAVTNPYTPQQNGCAERSNRTIVELARTMLLSKNLPKNLWAEAVNTAIYILNRTGPSSIEGKTPFELFTGKTIHLNNFHVFGTACFVHKPKELRKKWDSKSEPGIFVGYSDNIGGFRIWQKSKNQIIRSRDVVFEPEEAGKTVAMIPVEISDESNEAEQESDPVVNSSHDSDKESGISNFKEPEILKSTPKKLEQRELRDRTKLKPPRRLIELMLTEVNEPKNYLEALESAERIHWKTAMDEEMASLEENSTWKLVDLPTDCKPISNRWIYRIKRDSKGKINRYKARLVVRGFSQRKGIDYEETFSPVARLDTVRMILSIAASERLNLAQFDVKTAFLNGIIKENIYMEQPQGYEDGSNRVCKLQRSLYGLKQSPRCWNERFKDVVLNYGLSESTADPCLYYRVSGDDKLIVVLYVDDGLIAATKKASIEELLDKLKEEFKITIEPIGCFLNILINQEEDGSIFITQKMYAEDVLRRFNMNNANPVSTPFEKSQLTGEDDDTDLTTAPFREAVGCLMYLAVATRPDIAFAVNYVSRFLERPKQQHWSMVKRIMKYIKGTITLGIRYNNSAENLECFSDADYAGDPTTRRSVSGTVFKYTGGAIIWTSRRQQSVTLSTTEAEYVAACEAAKDIVWMDRLFDEISPLKDVPILYVDNASAIKLAKNPGFHRRSKHIDVRFHFVRELVQKCQLKIEHVSSEDQLADILTKSIPRIRFERLRVLLGIVEERTL